MPRVGLFPLSVVLLPTERIPLHIFETRYKELVNGCLIDDKPFGMVLVAAERSYEVGTYAHVVEVLERFEDGRMNIVVEGSARFQIVGTYSDRPYFTADVVEYTDDPSPSEAGVSGFVREYKAACERHGLEPVEAESGDVPLSYRVAASLALGLEDKQVLLELKTEAGRLDKLRELLPEALVAARAQLIRQRAAGNGHVRRML